MCGFWKYMGNLLYLLSFTEKKKVSLKKKSTFLHSNFRLSVQFLPLFRMFQFIWNRNYHSNKTTLEKLETYPLYEI